MPETQTVESGKTPSPTFSITEERPSFLRLLSHRLAAYLHGVIGYSEILKEQYFGPLNEKQAEYLGEITSSAVKLQNLINEAIELFKYESGEMLSRFTERDVRGIILEALLDVRDANGTRIDTDIAIQPEMEDVTGHFDETKFQRALVYLVASAAACAPPGKRVGVDVSGTSDQIEIKVHSPGVGVLAGVEADVFAPFHPNLESGQFVSPLGLSLAKCFLEIHNGTITVLNKAESDNDHFLIKLPVCVDIPGRNLRCS